MRRRGTGSEVHAARVRRGCDAARRTLAPLNRLIPGLRLRLTRLELPIHAAEELADPVASAEAAGLRYTTDDAPGIRRRRAGKGFSYLGPDSKAIRDEKALARAQG